MSKVYTRKLIEIMWAQGMPTSDGRYADIYRAALKAGLDDAQAFALVKEAYHAACGFEWQLAPGTALHRATLRREAAAHPNGKCAETLAAEVEGRPSRWGTPEFHRGPSS